MNRKMQNIYYNQKLINCFIQSGLFDFKMIKNKNYRFISSIQW